MQRRFSTQFSTQTGSEVEPERLYLLVTADNRAAVDRRMARSMPLVRGTGG